MSIQPFDLFLYLFYSIIEMTLTTHAFVGAAIGTLTVNPIGGFFLGFLSHFVIDAIPHGHYPLISFLRSNDPSVPYSRRALVAIAIDGIVATVAGTLLFLSAAPLLVVLCAVFGGMLPDLLLGTDIYFPSRLTRSFVRFHEGAHFFFFRKQEWQFPMPLVLVTEFGMIVLSITRLL